MKYVLDASVAVAALRANEPNHGVARARCTPFFDGADDIVVPAIFDVEVVSALARRGAPLGRIEDFFQKHFATRRLITLGPAAARAARAIAAKTRLRAADAFYVWVAMREGVPLVTLDTEMLARAASICTVEPP